MLRVPDGFGKWRDGLLCEQIAYLASPCKWQTTNNLQRRQARRSQACARCHWSLNLVVFHARISPHSTNMRGFPALNHTKQRGPQ